MSQTSEKKPLSLTDKFFSDNIAILILLLAIPITVILYWYASQTTAYNDFKRWVGEAINIIWPILLAAPNTIYSIVKTFRQKILFRNSQASVKVNKGPKVLLWILDGCNVQAFLDVARKNRELRTMYEEGYFGLCTTIFPSITPAAHSSLLTGCYPYKTHVPAFDWVEVKKSFRGEETREYIRVMPDFKHFMTQGTSRKYQVEFFKKLGDAFKLNQEYLSSMIYTVFESLGEEKYTVSIKEWIHRGADNFVGESINASLDELVQKKVISNNSMMELLNALFKEVDYEFGGLVWGVDSFRQLADFMVYWKTGTDTMSHDRGPKSNEVRDEIDEAIGKLAETLRFYKMYTNQPIYVVITSDHSQSEVTQFSGMVADFRGSLGGTYSIADRDDFGNTIKLNSADIIVANNDRAVSFYVFGGQEKQGKIREDIVRFLGGRADVDLIMYLENGRGQVIQPSTTTGPVDAEVFFSGKEGMYPNALERVYGLLKGDNWGSIVVSMKEGYSLNLEFKPGKEGEAILNGDHGGLNYNDSICPLLLWGPTVRKNEKDDRWERFRTIDIAPTICSIFGIEHKEGEGRVLKELFINNPS